MVSLEEFYEYYNNVSMFIDSDEYFQEMMRNCWTAKSYAKGWRRG